MFTHYLVTRFNIRISGYGPESMNSPEMNTEWLTERLRLFLKYCAPSVMEQTNKHFTWLIYLDHGTPQNITERIQFPEKDKITAELVFSKDFSMMLQDLVQKIKNSTTPYVITSRLDNDDIISKYFIDDIQRAFQPHHGMIINFTRGYEFNLRKHVLTKWNARFKNQFISIIEKRESNDIKSIYGFPHWRDPADSSILNIAGQPYWIYIGHQLNHSGLPITGIPFFSRPNDLNLFPVSIREIRLSFPQTIWYTLKWLPKVFRRRWKAIKNKKS